MTWTYESILNRAPDAIVFERAKELSSTRHWKVLAGNADFIFGECKSSGAILYQSFLDVNDGSFLCSCQEEKRPCRHVLALMLIYFNSAHLIRIVDFLPEWLPALREKEQKAKAMKADVALQKEKAKAKTRDARFEIMQAGVKELETWLSDIIRQGLAAIDGQRSSFWEDFATRMVDAKLGAVAKKIRLLQYSMHKEHWQDHILRVLAELYLFAKAFKQIDQLPEGMQQELLSYAGVTIKKEELLNQIGIQDRWLVLGKQEGTEENLRYRRTWLLGEKTGQFALILDFVWGRNTFVMDWKESDILEAELVYYPGAYPIRAVLKRFQKSKIAFEALKGFPSMEHFAKKYAEVMALNPWINTFPVLLEKVYPYLDQKEFFLFDEDEKVITLNIKGNQAWKLLAISGGQAISVFGEWDGQALYPISAFIDNRLVKL